MPDGLVWTPTPVVSLDGVLVIMPQQSIESIWDRHNLRTLPRREGIRIGLNLAGDRSIWDNRSIIPRRDRLVDLFYSKPKEKRI